MASSDKKSEWFDDIGMYVTNVHDIEIVRMKMDEIEKRLVNYWYPNRCIILSTTIPTGTPRSYRSIQITVPFHIRNNRERSKEGMHVLGILDDSSMIKKCIIAYKWYKYCRIQTPQQELYSFIKENGHIEEDSWTEILVWSTKSSDWDAYLTVKMWMTYEKMPISRFKPGFVYKMIDTRKSMETILHMKPIYMDGSSTVFNLFRCDERTHKTYGLSDDYYLRIDEHILSNFVLLEECEDAYKEPLSKRQRND